MALSASTLLALKCCANGIRHFLVGWVEDLDLVFHAQLYSGWMSMLSWLYKLRLMQHQSAFDFLLQVKTIKLLFEGVGL